ncbi:MAG: hypothetical protein WCZ89_07115 [Phycisphaerae bacterium]
MVWDGIVEVFRLIDHPKTKVCYAWGNNIEDKKKKSRYIMVLEISPVDSPLATVRASIISDSKSHKE